MRRISPAVYRQEPPELCEDFVARRFQALYDGVPWHRTSNVVEFARVAHSVPYQRLMNPRIDQYLGNPVDSPYPSKYFDAVLSADTIEYVEDPELLVAEMARITKPGGFFRIAAQFAHPYNPPSIWALTPSDLLVMFTYHALGNTAARVDVIGNDMLATGWR